MPRGSGSLLLRRAHTLSLAALSVFPRRLRAARVRKKSGDPVDGGGGTRTNQGSGLSIATLASVEGGGRSLATPPRQNNKKYRLDDVARQREIPRSLPVGRREREAKNKLSSVHRRRRRFTSSPR